MANDSKDQNDGSRLRDLRLGRRRFLQAGVAAGAAGVAGAGLSSKQGRLIENALARSSGGSSLSDVEHVVILMQENRSFDHYFGTLSGVRGFSDHPVLTQTVGGKKYPIFDQFGYKPGVGVDKKAYLQPFHLVSDPPKENGQTTNDITHDWGPQHLSWNNGAMDAFLTQHILNDGADERSGDDGLLHPRRSGLLLRARRRIHDLRRVPLLGSRPDRPEPGHVHFRDRSIPPVSPADLAS